MGRMPLFCLLLWLGLVPAETRDPAEKGRTDDASVAEISVMFYYT